MFRTATRSTPLHRPRTEPPERGDGTLIGGLVAGIIGGLAGAWMMDRYHKVAARFQETSDEPGSGEQGGRQAAGQDIGGEHEESEEPATEKAATAIVTGILGRTMSKEQKRFAGTATHYAFGASVGGFYGVLAEAAPVAGMGMGLPYGAGVWLVGDELAVPALGLARPPQEHPASTHANALVAHLIFGLTLEIVRRIVRRLI
jgi:putative membrane protein